MNNEKLTGLRDIVNVILDNKGLDPLAKIDREMTLREDLGLDSLDLAELTVRIEKAYAVDVFKDGLVATVAEVLDKVESV